MRKVVLVTLRVFSIFGLLYSLFLLGVLAYFGFVAATFVIVRYSMILTAFIVLTFLIFRLPIKSKSR